MREKSVGVNLAMPLTTKMHYGTWKCIILNQARTLDRERLEEKIIEIKAQELWSVKRAYCKLISAES